MSTKLLNQDSTTDFMIEQYINDSKLFESNISDDDTLPEDIKLMINDVSKK